jgi:hypothetical protein
MKYKISKTDDLRDRLNNRLWIRFECRFLDRLGNWLWTLLRVRIGFKLSTLLCIQLRWRLENRLRNYEV